MSTFGLVIASCALKTVASNKYTEPYLADRTGLAKKSGSNINSLASASLSHLRLHTLMVARAPERLSWRIGEH